MRVAVFRTAAVAAFLVPVVQIPMLIWAREAFLDLHPAYLADPPTISRAISEPMVGVPFHNTIVLVTVLLAVVMPFIIVSYWRSAALARIGGLRGGLIRLAIGVACVSQIAAVFGMNLLTVNTLGSNGDLHMLGSYIFFAAQAVTIAIAATLCRGLSGHTATSWLLPSMQRFRFPMGMAVLGLTLVYLGLFIGKDHNSLFSDYLVQTVYVQCEVLVISSFMLFLATYSFDLWSLGRRGGEIRAAEAGQKKAAGSRVE
ncbi:MAG: hypothetical protein ACKOED_04640 [Aestuariivirga sp.]|uniref:hypothetical protein n=1 Tax=Aestuariivirga sp. TaxID=2650926 RepID=UPI0038D1A724